LPPTPPTPPTGPLARCARALALALALAAGWSLPSGAFAAEPLPGARSEELGVLAITLEHQRAGEAVALVEPLLSPRGSIELQAGTNTLVVRDSLSALGRIRAALRAFDHPARPVALDVQIVRADRGMISPLPAEDGLDAALRQRLETLFRFRSYRLLSRARLGCREGEQIAYEMPGDYRLSFRLGTVVADPESARERIRLHGFRVARGAPGGGEQELTHTLLNLWLDQPTILGLTRDEASPSALMLVLTFERDAERR